MVRLITFLLFFLCSVISHAAVVILNGLSHVHQVAEGLSISGRIKVQNNGTKPAGIMVYNEDLMLSCDKPVDYQKINSHDRSLGHWLKTNVEEKVLQPNEVYDVSYTITIPAESKGSYWSVIMVEGADPVKEEKGTSIKIDSKVRYAVLIIANSGTVESPKIAFEQMKITPVDSSAQAIKVKLKNSGVFVASTRLSIELYDAAGNKVKTVEANPRRVYPDKCIDLELVIRDLPKGKYDGVLIADNGQDLYGANINLQID